MFSLGDAETQNSIFKIFRMQSSSKICWQNSAEMCIIMISSVCDIAYKNVTSETHNGVQEVFTVKTSL